MNFIFFIKKMKTKFNGLSNAGCRCPAIKGGAKSIGIMQNMIHNAICKTINKPFFMDRFAQI
jgi:hypothetical protein